MDGGAVEEKVQSFYYGKRREMKLNEHSTCHTSRVT